MMNKKDFLKLTVGSVFYTVNPYSNGDQTKVKLVENVVESLNTTGTIFKEVESVIVVDDEYKDHPSVRTYYVSDYLSCGKMCTLDIKEADKFHKFILSGGMADKVKRHHESCLDLYIIS